MMCKTCLEIDADETNDDDADFYDGGYEDCGNFDDDVDDDDDGGDDDDDDDDDGDVDVDVDVDVDEDIEHGINCKC